MLKYKQRETFTPPRAVTFSVFYMGTPPSWSPPFANPITYTWTIPPLREAFERLLSDDTSSRKLWKPCQHYTSRRVYPKGTSKMLFPWSVPSITAIGGYTTSGTQGGVPPEMGILNEAALAYTGALGGTPLGIPLMTEELPDGGFIPAPIGLSDLVQRSLNAMLPSIKSKLSLINTFIELKDFSSLPRTLEKAKSLFSYFKTVTNRSRLTPTFLRVRKTFSKSHGPTLNEALDLGADGYLQYAFNIRPLLDDIMGVYSALVARTKVISDLIKRQGQLQKRHYTFKYLPLGFSSEDASLVYSPDDPQLSVYHPLDGLTTGAYGYHMRGQFRLSRSVLISKPAIFHAEVEFNYNFTRFQAEHAQILGLLDQLGINLNPAIIWNAIPWSFVVDWFISVSRWLSNYKVQNMKPDINITRYLWSWKVQRRIISSFQSFQDANCPPVPTTYLPELVETIYRRDVGIPAHSYILSSGLSPKEFTLGAALIHTNEKSFHRTRAR